jgi:AcrR family transcriptional regulator
MAGTSELPTGSDRDRVLLATAELCALVGYEEMRVEAIAERAQVSPERFDELFGGKEEATMAAVDAILTAVMEVVGSRYSADRSEVESFVLGIEGILELMAESPAFAYVSYIGARQLTPRRLKGEFDIGVQLLTALLERLWAYSTEGAQPPNAARAALGGAEAVVRREIAYGRTKGLPRLLPDFIYCAAVPFLGQKEALRLARLSQPGKASDG